jgi:4-amino-4-deoxy-L-arabinose transferase-like glycosyltransferase
LLKTLNNRYPFLLNPSSISHQRILIYVVIIFMVAFATRTIAWYYWRAEALVVQSSVAANYKVFARLLVTEGLTGFFRVNSAMSNPDLLSHPPGYPLLLALVYKIAGESDTVVQFLQIAVDALAVVLIFLIAIELLKSTTAFVAGMFAAMSPQLAWNSIFLLPDSLSILPLLSAIYLYAHARTGSRLWRWFAVGGLIGISCLLRPNALLLAPFLGIWILVFGHGSALRKRISSALVLVLGAIILIAPFTIRNAIVFGRFVPLSLGAGQTLLEGIADYDPEQSLGFADTDTEIARLEAERFNRPDYARTLFGPDAIDRERFRLREGLRAIAANPIWFSSVMVQRAMSMLRIERVPLISAKASTKTGYPKVIRYAQTIFITAVILPLSLLGLIVLVLGHRWSALVVLLAIPAYYFCVQSALHTEYRYILAMNHFHFVFAAVGCLILPIAIGKRLKPGANG